MSKQEIIIAGNIKLLVGNFSEIDICFGEKSGKKNNQLAAFVAAEQYYQKNKKSRNFRRYVMADHVGKNLEAFLDKNKFQAKPKRKDLLEPNLAFLAPNLLQEFNFARSEIADFDIISEATLRLTIHTILRNVFLANGYTSSLPSLKDLENFLYLDKHNHLNSENARLLHRFFTAVTNSRLAGNFCGNKISQKRTDEPWINCEGIFLALWYRLARKLHKARQTSDKLSLTAFFGIDEMRCNKNVIAKSLAYFFALFPNNGISSIRCIFVEQDPTKEGGVKYAKILQKSSAQDILVYTPEENFEPNFGLANATIAHNNQDRLRVFSIKDLQSLSCSMR